MIHPVAHEPSRESLPEDNIGLISHGYEAYARRDFPAVFALLHPEIEIFQTELLPWGGTYRGQEQARDFFRRLSEHVEATPEPEAFIDAGDRVVAVGRLRGRARASGQTFDLAIVHLWTVRDGRVARFEAYIDTPQMLRALAGQNISQGRD